MAVQQQGGVDAVRDLLHRCIARGITLSVDGGVLRANGPRAHVDQLMPELKEHTDMLIALLGPWSRARRPADFRRYH